MNLIDNLNNSFFINFLNKILDLVQKKLIFCTKNSFFIQNIDKIIVFFTFLILTTSTFLDSEQLGLSVIATFILLIIKFLTKQNEKIKIDGTDLFVILYLIFFCLATCFSSWFLDSIHGLIKTITYFFSYIIFKSSIKQNPRLRLSFLVLLAILCANQAIIGIHQQLFGVEALAGWQDMNNIDPTQAMTRVFGTLKPLNPNLMAGYLIASMPAIITCIFYNFKKKYINFIALAMFFAAFASIVFTGCRGAYVSITAQTIAFIAISGHLIWHDFKDRPYLKKIWLNSIIIGILGMLGLVLSQEALQKRILSIFAQREDSSNSFRFNVYQSSLNMFKDNYLSGIGVGNWTFREVYGLYMRTGFDALGAYSVPLEIAVETGVLGLLNFSAFIFTTIISTSKKILSKICYNEKIILSTALISIIGMMAHGIVDTVWFRPQIQFVFWLMIAILSTSNEENL